MHGELLNLDEEDAKRHYAGGMSANRINAGLGTIIQQVLEVVGKDKVAGLYTTGGDTMVNVCYQLGVECIEVLDYVIPQTDIGRLIGSPYSGLPVVERWTYRKRQYGMRYRDETVQRSGKEVISKERNGGRGNGKRNKKTERS